MRVAATTTILLVFCSHSFALTCALSSQDEAIRTLEKLYGEAEIVAYTEFVNQAAADVYEVKVERVWKGSIGKTAFVRGQASGPVLANRVDDGPLMLVADPTFLHCRIMSLSIDGPMRELEKLEQLWGKGSVPNSPVMEDVTSMTQSAWLASIVVGGSVLMLVIVSTIATWKRRIT